MNGQDLQQYDSPRSFPSMAARNQTDEDSPLLHRSDADAHRLGWTRDAIRAATLSAAFLVVYASADVFRYISTIQLLERGACRERYPKHFDGPDSNRLCKSSEVQQELARMRGHLAALDAVVGLLLALPYGLMVGRLGERLVAAVNVVGYLLSCAWLLVVCLHPGVFPVWTAVLSPLFRAVGGGAPVLSSVIYSIAAKHVPDAHRSLCFFFFTAAQLLTEMAAMTATAIFLDKGFLFTPLMLNFPLSLFCLAILALVPTATKPLDKLPTMDAQTGEVTMLVSMRENTRALSRLLRNVNVIALLAAVPMAKLSNPVNELMFQYIPKKFDSSLAFASRALAMQAFESLALLILVLPVIKNLAQTRLHAVSTIVDLRIAQCGFLVMSLGCVTMALAQRLAVFILGFVLFTLGCSTRPALQSLLTDLVRREQVAVLYTAVAVGDGVGTATGAFVLNRALAISIGWETKLYLGLPFLIGASCFMFGFSASTVVGCRLRSPLISQT